MAKQKKPVESVSGGYSALPWAVMDSPAYTGASIAAKALLCALIRQHNGANNGRLHLSHKWLAPRGWPSKSTVEKARAELIERGLIVQTKQGGLFIGPTWFAVTWLPISNHVGLDIGAHQYHKGAYLLCKLPPTARRKPPTKKNCQPVHRGSADPTTGAVSRPADPTTGAINAVSGGFPDPTTGDDVLLPLPPVKTLTPDWRIGGWRCVGLLPPGRIRPRVRLFKTTPANRGHHHGHHGH